MAQVNICRAVALILFIAALFSMTAVGSAQDVDLAPSPSMDAGAAFPVTVSAGFVCLSLFSQSLLYYCSNRFLRDSDFYFIFIIRIFITFEIFGYFFNCYLVEVHVFELL